jgi:hypothetical protein
MYFDVRIVNGRWFEIDVVDRKPRKARISLETIARIFKERIYRGHEEHDMLCQIARRIYNGYMDKPRGCLAKEEEKEAVKRVFSAIFSLRLLFLPDVLQDKIMDYLSVGDLSRFSSVSKGAQRKMVEAMRRREALFGCSLRELFTEIRLWHLRGLITPRYSRNSFEQTIWSLRKIRSEEALVLFSNEQIYAVSTPLLCQYLLQKGRRQRVRDDLQTLGTRGLMRAIREDRQDVAKVLLFHGARVNEADENGFSPLFYAVEMKRVDIARFLLGKRAFVGHLDRDQNTALHWAALLNDGETVALLLSWHADTAARNRWGVTPLRVALHQGSGVSAALLSDR